jgi:hypothetical protein
VACDRLGRGDEAIAWMERKKAQLDALDPATEVWKEHQYRYLANLGTFVIHRWFRQGANREQIAQVSEARDLIKAAIALNPDAHFGRERYQLMIMEWIYDGPKVLDGEQPVLQDFFGGSKHLRELDDSVEGLLGLMVLGNAWESVDVTYGLMLALASRGKNVLAHVAELRCYDLIDSGLGSLCANAPEGDELKELVRFHSGEGSGLVYDEIKAANLKEYQRQRANADEWHAHREAYMIAKLEQERHPDTDPKFWSEYDSIDPIAAKRVLNIRTLEKHRALLRRVIVTCSVVALFGAVILWLVRRRRRMRSALRG